jgi:hypothetical protein
MENNFEVFKVGNMTSDFFQAMRIGPGQELVQKSQPPRQIADAEYLEFLRKLNIQQQ